MYGGLFVDKKGTDEVGSMDIEGRKATTIRKAPVGEYENFRPIPIKF